MKKFVILTAIVFCLLASVVFSAAADERILNYDVSAVLDKDASLLITERITVNAENKVIRRGITRSFPIKERVGKYGLRRYSFDVVSVKCDGIETTFRESVNGYMAGMAIGDEKEYIPKGRHTYEIVYRTRGHVSFLPKQDEIYFNAIGLDNQFPVDKGAFTLTLPGGENPIFTKAWTGKSGATGADYIKDGNTFRTTRVLEPGEGFTIAEGWRKGLVPEPSNGISDWLGMNRTPALLGLLAALLIYLLAAWFFLYRNGAHGTVIPIFHAPDGVSPGLAAWMMSDRDIADEALMFQGDMLWLAVNGWASMDLCDSKKIILKSARPSTQKKNWVTDACSSLHDLFFGKSEEVDFSKKGTKAGSLAYAYNNVMEIYNGKNVTLGDGTEEFQNGQTDKLYDVSFLPGLVGLVAALGIFWWLLGRIAQPGLDLNYSSFTMMWYPGGLFLLVSIIWSIVPMLARGEKAGMRMGIIITAAVVSALILAFLAFILKADWFFIAVFQLIILLPCLFTVRFSVRLTPEGRKLQNKLSGLKMYIETAEKERLSVINAPDDTVEKYEEILPYAVALGCGEAWQDRFDPLLEGVDYVPKWTEYDPDEEVLRKEEYRREVLRRAAADAAAANSAASAIRKAAERCGQTKSKSSSGESSSSSGSDGSAGGGSGGGGVGGW